MKQIKLYSFIILSLTVSVSFGQNRPIKDTLIKKTEKSRVKPGKLNVKYLDGTWQEDKFPRPKDNSGHIPEIIDGKLNSIEKLNSIVTQIFTEDEIRYLYSNKCYVACWASSSGKIVRASIIFYGNDPDVNVNQLSEFSEQIKENLTFEFTFAADVKYEGFIYYTFPAFKALLHPWSLKGYHD